MLVQGFARGRGGALRVGDPGRGRVGAVQPSAGRHAAHGTPAVGVQPAAAVAAREQRCALAPRSRMRARSSRGSASCKRQHERARSQFFTSTNAWTAWTRACCLLVMCLTCIHTRLESCMAANRVLLPLFLRDAIHASAAEVQYRGPLFCRHAGPTAAPELGAGAEQLAGARPLAGRARGCAGLETLPPPPQYCFSRTIGSTRRIPSLARRRTGTRP